MRAFFPETLHKQIMVRCISERNSLFFAIAIGPRAALCQTAAFVKLPSWHFSVRCLLDSGELRLDEVVVLILTRGSLGLEAGMLPR